MNTGIRKLPIGIQNFEDLRARGFVYVDKTAFVYQLVTMGKPYFLSRPRRFGKSLLISTFEAYFEGKKELFKGLAIEKLEEEWATYPVLHMDLNAEKYDSVKSLDTIIDRHLFTWEDLWGKDERETTLPSRFMGVIRRAWEKTGKQAVVLIDEYDKPLLQTFDKEALQEEYRDTLKSFYGVLKSADRYLRFVFLTGVTKFAQVSVFSDLNQLNDISMNPDYATLCGITREELTDTFKPELELTAQSNGLSYQETIDLMARKYDGYHFRDNTPGVFNPFSVLNALQSRRFDNFWFHTGTPSFLVEILKKSEFDLRTLIDGIEAEPSSFTEYRANAKNPIPIIYQSGYLTIKEYDREFNLYILRFPNEEVEYGFMNFLLPFYSSIPDKDKGFHIGKFVRELRGGDTDAFLNRLRAFFADFPYELNDKTERHYQVVFYLVFKLMGQFCDAEVRSARGRADAVVKTADYIYLFEFKLDGSATQAIQQINEKGYLIPYTADGRKLVKVGVSFNTADRNLGEWLVEE